MWLKSNELSINDAKTKVMIFSNKRPIPDFRFVLNNNDPNSSQNPLFIHEIERLKSSSKTPFFKMLGVYFDESLSFNYHCKKVNSKISSALFMISRAKHLLSENSLKRLYYAIIHPHLLYCLPIYSFTSKKNISTLFKKQKQAIRVINKAKYNSHTEPLFHKCDILPLNDLIIQQKLIFMHPLAHNCSPVSFRNFIKLSDVQLHDYPLRNNNDFYIPRGFTSVVSKMPLIDFPYTWNALDEPLKIFMSKNVFKKSVKERLMNQYANFRCSKSICFSCLNIN